MMPRTSSSKTISQQPMTGPQTLPRPPTMQTMMMRSEMVEANTSGVFAIM